MNPNPRPEADDPNAPVGEPAPDKVEIWARRTGRTLGFVALFGLALYLLHEYGPL